MTLITEGDVDARASCIPSHIHHIMFEVLKNALKATALNHAAISETLPPVRVRIAQVIIWIIRADRQLFRDGIQSEEKMSKPRRIHVFSLPQYSCITRLVGVGMKVGPCFCCMSVRSPCSSVIFAAWCCLAAVFSCPSSRRGRNRRYYESGRKRSHGEQSRLNLIFHVV